MKKNLNNSFNKASTIVALSIILGTVAYAWTGPTVTAPNNNTAAPINVSATAQTKSGPFSLSGPFTIINGYKGYSGLTIASDDPSTMVTKSYVDAKVETDPTVPAYVKDGTDWSEVTNKPTQMSGSIVAGCSFLAPNTAPNCWGGASGNYWSSGVWPAVPVCPPESTYRMVYFYVTPGENGGGYSSFLCTKN